MKTTYHSHCSFCDGKAPMEAFVKEAIAQGFAAYGISSHAPLPFENKWAMAYGDMAVYLEEFSRLREKYKRQIELYVGLEIDYVEGVAGPADAYYQELPLDYRLGSVHVLVTPSGELVDVDAGTEKFKEILEKKYTCDLKRLIGDYFKTSVKMVEAGGIDFVGHCDKIHHNAEAMESGITDTVWYRSLLETFFDRIAERGIFLEINTKGLAKKGCFFPDKKSFPLIKELAIPIVVNSDAHLPELVNAGRDEAIKALKATGFKTSWHFIEGKWQEFLL